MRLARLETLAHKSARSMSKKASSKVVAERWLTKVSFSLLADDQSAQDAFFEEFQNLQSGKKKYKSLAGNKVVWITAYKENNPKAIDDYKKFVQGKARGDLKKIQQGGSRIKEKSGALAKSIVGALNAVKDTAKSEVAGMVKTPKVLFDMAKGDYDFSDKEKLKEDSKMIWGSMVYYGGVALALATGGVSTTAVALGKSVATHAVIGAVSSKADFFGFLSLEATETVAGFAGEGASLANSLGFVSTDLFDSVASGALTALKTVVASSEKEKDDDPNAVMEKVLKNFFEHLGDSVGSMSKEDENEVLNKAYKR